MTPRHPAPFHPSVIDIAEIELSPIADKKLDTLRVLDPFAGVGGIHALAERNGGITTYGVELMPRWAAAHICTWVGDATKLDWTDGYFDAVVTSPCYANRMADHHVASDKCSECKGTGLDIWSPCRKCKGTGLSPRRSYAHYYGEGFFDVDVRDNAGAMQWGDEYRDLHERAWAEVYRVLKPSPGTPSFLLNIKDHIRDGHRVRVSRWHRRTILDLGFVELGRWDIPTSGYGYGENNGARVPNEYVYVFAKEQS